MSLRVDGSVVPYEGNSSNRSKRETVEDAATATGAAGAGAGVGIVGLTACAWDELPMMLANKACCSGDSPSIITSKQFK